MGGILPTPRAALRFGGGERIVDEPVAGIATRRRRVAQSLERSKARHGNKVRLAVRARQPERLLVGLPGYHQTDR